MTRKPVPRDSFLCELEVFRAEGNRKIWKSPDGERLYAWDQLHGEVEVYNKRGKHLGVVDPISGEVIGKAVKGRSIHV